MTGGGTYTPPTVGSKEVDPAAAAYPSVPYPSPPEYSVQPSSAPCPNEDAADPPPHDQGHKETAYLIAPYPQ